ncbi:hypothetical protein [Nocardia amamiensis]|uniref:hypothetical protein n=1 Tax=Nocardia amamiensis TaxID=404578 RepID=UPI0008296AEA|nr:hypothetical protein [Nocardia amamiensis]
MVLRRILRAAGFARLLGVLALLAGIVAMHSAVFAGVGHAAGVHHIASPTPGPDAAARATVAGTQPNHDGTPAGHDKPRGHTRITPRDGVIDTGHVWTPPPHNGTLPGLENAGLPGRTEAGVEPNRVWARSSHDGTAPGHDQHRTGDAGKDGFFRSAGGTSVVMRVADGFGRTIVVGESSDPWTTAVRAVTATFAATGMPGPDCAGDGCDRAHSGMHGCVFILVVLTSLVALVLLYRMAADRPGRGVARPRHWRPRRERPPPWTVLTLAELAILRI